MEILTEFDELQNAMAKINLDESVFPYCNGRLINDVAYNKIQKILNCPEMVSCHKYLYNLDLDQLNEDEVDKVDKLYKLGCDRGFIVDDLTNWDVDAPVDAAVDGIVNATKDDVKQVEEKPAKEKPIAGTLFKAKIPCWTIIYSATSKDGQIKTGEAYSNAISANAAKADVKSKLSTIGYSNITILAIESCEADVEATSFKDDDTSATVSDETVTVSEADDETSDDETEEKTEEKSEEETEEKTEEKSDDETEEKTEEKSDDSTESEDETEETSDDESSDEDTEEKTEEKSEEETDEDAEDKTEETKEDSEDEDNAEKSDDAESEELDVNEKAELKDKYKKTFKNTLIKCKFTKSFNDLSLEEKVKFFTQLSKAWTKNEPNEFMTDKEMEQLNNIVVNPDDED